MPPAGDKAQTDEPVFIRMRMARYGAMLMFDPGDENRTTIGPLRAEAEQKLKAVTALKEQH